MGGQAMLGGFTEMMVLPGTQRDLLHYAPSPGLPHCPCGPHGPPGRAREHRGWTVPAGEAAGEAAGSSWSDGLGQTPQGEGTPSEALLASPVPTQHGKGHGWSRMCHSEPQQSHSRFWAVLASPGETQGFGQGRSKPEQGLSLHRLRELNLTSRCPPSA